MVAPALLAVQRRANRVEVEHVGHAVLLAADGSVKASWGDPEAWTYTRSAVKPLQALTSFQANAWTEFDLPPEALAIACGSHAGEAAHRETVEAMLAAGNIDSSAMQCATHRPWSRHSVRLPDGPDGLGNNCSGKHAAMLLACKAAGWPLDGYLHPNHPLQQAMAGTMARAIGAEALDWAIDGCGVPTWWIRVKDLAASFQWMLKHGNMVFDAMAAHPVMVSGTGQFCSDLPPATRGVVIGKYGALGVYAAVNRGTGEAMALKLLSGDEKAAKAAAMAMMRDAGWLDEEAQNALVAHQSIPVQTCSGLVVGSMSAELAARD